MQEEITTDLGHQLAQLPKQSLTTGFKAGVFMFSDDKSSATVHVCCHCV